MTSNINFSAIDETYPVAGKDNNSQGFRDNFSATRAGLATAKAEISDLQIKSLLNQDLVTTDPVVNDLNGSSITNGYYNNFHGLSHIATVAGSTTIDVSAASVHVFTLTADTSFTFTNWPTSGYFAKVKIHFLSNTSDHTASLFSTGGGVIRKDGDFPAPFTAPSTGKHQVVEAWSYNHGASVFVKYLGSF
jgi:hypothetical protein